MTVETRQDAADKRMKQLLHYLDLAMNPKVGLETAVNNSAAELLKSLDYDDENCIAFIHHAIPFLICGQNLVAQTDLCIMDDNQILFLLQEDKRLTSMNDPEPQVIAKAIAAFALNNRKQERKLNPPCDSIMLPCLTMVGTMPIIYKVTVTATPSNAVQTGAYPEIETRVFRHIPGLPLRNSEGMRPLQNRLEIL